MSKPKKRNYKFLKNLFLVFLTLKLIHQIDWSWWWVTAPLWGSLLLEILSQIIENHKSKEE